MTDPLSVYVASSGPPIRLLDEKIDTASNLWNDARMGADACCAVDWAGQYASLMSRSRNEINNFAALRIQQMVRLRLARSRVNHIRDYKRIDKGLRVMRKVLLFKVKIMRNRPFVRATTVLQRCWRGWCARDLVYRKIAASLVIGKVWRKYSLAVLLQASLRRIERPVEIKFKSLENIPAQHAEGSIMIRVSMWWFGLLHIATGQDCITAIQSKKPQCVWTSKPQPLTVVEMDEPNVTEGTRGRSASGAGVSLLETLGVRNRSGSHSDNDGVRSRSGSAAPPAGILRCELTGLRILIPAIHGNSVIKFDILDQDE